ncbi:hypothetical protein [Kineosporia babensis]|uniref:Lipoprotein n=1 Tax=Kineosporia babensis TaxID=499548 RepID=A0A9X1SU11_9ACTN|nr:hypothetical protein [Kineosporia babensis]MCD5312432.1 hypothetical protein [Kineosporia babensis]
MFTRTACLLVVSALIAGCSSSPKAVEPAAERQPARTADELGELLLQSPQNEPHSARVSMTEESDTETFYTFDAWATFEDDDTTGHFRTKTFATEDTPAHHEEWIRTDSAAFKKVDEKPDPWLEHEYSPNPLLVPDVNGYARSLLEQPHVSILPDHQEDGITTTRISGQLAVEAIEYLEPRLYASLRSGDFDYIETMDVQICLDSSGRVVRFDRWLMVDSGFSAGSSSDGQSRWIYPESSHTLLRMSHFGLPFEQAAPTDDTTFPESLEGDPQTSGRPAA